jgi:YbbR domain-containing protein
LDGLVRRYLLNNWGLKLLSLLIAIGIWTAVAREPVAEVAYRVPVEFHNVPENLEIITEEVPQAQVRVRGPARRIRELAAADVHPVIDLAGVEPGERTLDLAAEQIVAPADIEVVQVIPSQIRITFDRRASKQVPVRPRVTGSFAAGYQLRRIASEPPTVTVVGPEQRVKDIQAAFTDPVDATGVVGEAHFTARPHVADALVRVARPLSVRVTVETERVGEP